MIADILRLRGFEILAARDDVEAYDLMQGDPAAIDVLVADVDLGTGTTGFDVARRARTLNPQVGVIYCTSRDKFRDAFAVPGAMLCPKPLNPLSLADAVERLMEAASPPPA